MDAPEISVGFTRGNGGHIQFSSAEASVRVAAARLRPEDAGSLSLGNNEGAGKTGCPMHPRPACSGR